MSLDQLRTPFVIVGGIATALYMPQRMTLDLDILVTPEDASQLHQELRHLGYVLERQLSIGGTGWRLDPEPPFRRPTSAGPSARSSGRTPRSSVLRVAVSKVRIPRSHSTTFGLPESTNAMRSLQVNARLRF